MSDTATTAKAQRFREPPIEPSSLALRLAQRLRDDRIRVDDRS